MTTNSATKVRFKIISCSSEDPQYPATELLQPSPQGKGWQSARFCDYPQEIIIQFLAPVRLKQVQFLCHQCKIPSKIELFSFIQDLNSVMPNTEFKWTKLGFLSLDPNDKSGYQARELKSVFLDIPALFLRFYFHKCHMNKYNLFNQVALVAVSVFGEPLTKDVLDRPTKAQQKYEKLGFTTHYDKFILERLTLLEDAKDVAVKAEDYKEAKRLKDAIDRLKFIATKIQDLETQKELAIQNEDYDQARSIKEEIERIKQSINPNEHIKPIEEQEQKTVIIDQPLEFEEYKKPDLNFKQEYGDETHVKKEIIQPYDEQVIPALRTNKGEQGEEDPFGGKMQNSAKNEKLSEEYIKQLETLITILGEDLVRKLSSRHWTERLEGLQLLNEELKKGQSSMLSQDPVALFVGVMGAIGVALLDPIIQINQHGMSILQTLLNRPTPKISLRGELQTYIDETTSGLLDKIGDTNHRVREHAEACYLLMCKNPVITTSHCSVQLVKNTGYGKHIIANSIRHTLGKLNLLRQLIKEYGINNNDVPYSPIVEYIVDNVENSNAEIRSVAFDTTVEIYKKVGDKLRENLMGLRKNIRESLESAFRGEGKKRRSPSPPTRFKGK